jgi:hypothetical protein
MSFIRFIGGVEITPLFQRFKSDSLIFFMASARKSFFYCIYKENDLRAAPYPPPLLTYSHILGPNNTLTFFT